MNDKQPTARSQTKRKFWKVQITPGFHEFERLAASHGMKPAQFLRAIPSLFGDHISKAEQRLWMARSLRYLECIHHQTSTGQRMVPELQHALEGAIADLRNAFNGLKRRVRRDH